MFCPSCATEVNETTKYCTKCGLDLRRLRNAMVGGKRSLRFKPHGPVDWEAVMIEEQIQKQKRTPEEKRLIEIKGGVITSCVGLGLMIFLFFLFSAIGNLVHPDSRDILRAIPFVGIIPFLVGAGIIFNGVVIGKRIVNIKNEQDEQQRARFISSVPETAPVPRLAEPSQSPISDYSVTESTTTKLKERVPVPIQRDND